MSIIHLEHIDFSYKKHEPILTDVNIEVPAGSVYGFLGANGAGKSTTLRVMLGLLKPQSGRIRLFGQDISDSYPAHLAHVGSLIESASLYDHLSAKDHLKIACQYFNAPHKKINEVLSLVKLDQAGSKKIKDFSTGMKQRLGMALALLHDPELLILDEPTNGLDPNGIIELRQIIQQLSQDNKTILLSSHILAEVEKLVSHIGIIKDGSIIFEGGISDLQQLRANNMIVIFKVSDSRAAMKSLASKQCKRIDDQQFSLQADDKVEIAEIIKTLVQQNIEIYEVKPQSSNLENMFLNVTMHDHGPVT